MPFAYTKGACAALAWRLSSSSSAYLPCLTFAGRHASLTPHIAHISLGAYRKLYQLHAYVFFQESRTLTWFFWETECASILSRALPTCTWSRRRLANHIVSYKHILNWNIKLWLDNWQIDNNLTCLHFDNSKEYKHFWHCFNQAQIDAQLPLQCRLYQNL